MSHAVNFTPGPSQLYFTVADHVKQAFRDGIPSLSHRSKLFENIFAGCTNDLRTLLNIPATHTIVFTGSATEIWERMLQSLVVNRSHHFVNGSFSKRFHEIAVQLGKQPSTTEVAPGLGFSDNVVPDDAELIALTHNETSTGVSMPMSFIDAFRAQHPRAIIAVDAVSSLPYPQFDYTKVDSVFFSVQKGFGLPAGLGVWIVNDACIERTHELTTRGHSTGSYHSLASLVEHAKKNQTPETPNVLGIYLLGKVVQDMLRRGIQQIRKETEYKAAILYQAMSQHATLKPFVQDAAWQSKTVIVGQCESGLADLVSKLNQKGLQPGDGYGPFKKSQLRFANFPAHSKEQFELLVDTLEAR
jgi:phosphoserine aminotransferase